MASASPPRRVRAHGAAATASSGRSDDSGFWVAGQYQDGGSVLGGVQLVVADVHAGIAKAVRSHLPEVPQQRCTVHLTRNVLTKAPQRLRSRLAKAETEVFEASTKPEAKKRMEALAASLGRQVPNQVTAIWTDRRYLDMKLLKPKEVVEAKAA